MYRPNFATFEITPICNKKFYCSKSCSDKEKTDMAQHLKKKQCALKIRGSLGKDFCTQGQLLIIRINNIKTSRKKIIS